MRKLSYRGAHGRIRYHQPNVIGAWPIGGGEAERQEDVARCVALLGLLLAPTFTPTTKK